jgi:tight adherence protein B
MSPGLLLLLAFLAAALAVAATYSILSDLFLKDRSRVSKRVDEDLRHRQRAAKAALFKDLSSVTRPLQDDAEARPSLRERLGLLLEQSGLALQPRRLLVFMAAGGLGLGAIAFLLRQNLLLAVAASLLGAAIPFLYVLRKRKVRLNKMLSQLPDAFDLMARVIRAGQTMSQAIQAVADEFQAPVATEFAYCYEQQNLGLPTEFAFRDLARRTGLLEMRIFVLALLVQQQTGGNLADLLDRLAGIIRERFRIRGKISALTAEGRMQALVLLGLPLALLLIILVINRSYAAVLLDHPVLLGGMFVSELLGALFIRKIVNFDF